MSEKERERQRKSERERDREREQRRKGNLCEFFLKRKSLTGKVSKIPKKYMFETSICDRLFRGKVSVRDKVQ